MSDSNNTSYVDVGLVKTCLDLIETYRWVGGWVVCVIIGWALLALAKNLTITNDFQNNSNYELGFNFSYKTH